MNDVLAILCAIIAKEGAPTPDMEGYEALIELDVERAKDYAKALKESE